MQVRILKGHTDLRDLVYRYPENWRVEYFTYLVVQNVKSDLKH